jgi:hypothetical protein
MAHKRLTDEQRKAMFAKRAGMSNYGKRIQESAKWWKPSPRKVKAARDIELPGFLQMRGKVVYVKAEGYRDWLPVSIKDIKNYYNNEVRSGSGLRTLGFISGDWRQMDGLAEYVVDAYVQSGVLTRKENSVSPLRQSQGEMLSDFAFKDKIVSKEKIGNNTLQITLDDGRVITRLHNTDIVTRMPNGDMVLDSGGWQTSTTASRLREAGVDLTVKKGKWFVGGKPFQDGMVISKSGKPTEKVVQAEKVPNSRYHKTDDWRGYEIPYKAVLGSSDTGMWSDSPCPSDKVEAELQDAKKFLEGKGIKASFSSTPSSNVFMVKRWLVVPERQRDVALKLAKQYLDEKKNETQYIHDAEA